MRSLSHGVTALFFLFLCMISVPAVRADVPALINYQGRLTASGTPLSGAYVITFSLYETAESGSAAWSETHEVEVVDGIFSVLLGSVADFPQGLFSAADALYLGIRVAGETELRPRQRLASAPYAIHAETVSTLPAGSVGSAQLAEGSVTSTKLAEGAAVSRLNGLGGSLTLTGSGGVSVAADGNTITITGEGGGGGGGGSIQAIQNSDNALEIANPVGPTVTIDVRNEGITESKLADDAVTSAKIADEGIEAVDLAPTAAVKTLNGLAGTVTLAGAGGATVSSSGNTITINAGSGGGGASGVQGVQNTDGFLEITDPNGPTVTIDVQEGGVTTELIRDLAVTTNKLSNLSVNSEKLANASATSAKIADGAVTSAKIADGAVNSAKIANGAVRADDLAANAAVKTLNTVAGDVVIEAGTGITVSRSQNTITISGGGTTAGVQSISSTDNALQVTNSNGPNVGLAVRAGGIVQAMLANGAVTNGKLADGAVDSRVLANGGVAAADLADGAVGSSKLAANAVTTAAIANGAVTGAKIASGAVGAAQLADDAAVQSLNDLSGAVTLRGEGAVNLSSDGNEIVIGVGAMGNSGITSINNDDGAITIANPSGPAVTLGIATQGIASAMIANDAITAAKIASGAVTADELAASSVGTNQLVDGAVVADKIAASAVSTSRIQDVAVTSSKLADNAVEADKIAGGAVGTSKMADAAVTTPKIADGAVTSDKLDEAAAVLSLAGLSGHVGMTGINGISVNAAGSNIVISYSQPSSIRWKSEVRTLESALDRVLRLRGVEYVWTATGESQIGFIAEEVGQVFPEMVQYEENGVDARSVDYSRMVAVLVEAMKDQQREIERQQEHVAQLMDRLDRLEQLLEGPSARAAADVR